MVEDQQKQIKDWFEKTYAERSKSYLRPTEAYEVFLSLLNPQPGQKLLDVACGPGQLLIPARPLNLQLYGIDLSENAIELAKKNLPEADLRSGNAESLPYPDTFFDHITCIGSLERIIHLDRALREQLRVAAPGARFCYMVRNDRTLSWQLKKWLGIVNKKGHQGAKGIEAWTSIFQEMGFFIEGIFPDQWPRMRWMRWINPRIDYKKAKKGMMPLRYANEFIFILRKA